MYKYLMKPMVLHYHQSSQPLSSFDIYIMHDCRMFWLESSIPKVALKHALGHDQDFFDMYDDKFTYVDLQRQLMTLLQKSRPVQKYSYPKTLENRLSVQDIWAFHKELKGTEDLLFTKTKTCGQLTLLRNEVVAKKIFEKWPNLEATKERFVARIQKNDTMLNAFLDWQKEISSLERLFIPEIGEIWLAFNDYGSLQLGAVIKNKFKKINK